MPVLLLRGEGLVKTVRFKDPQYVGDAINSARIFNQMEVDELVLLDIDATVRGQGIQFQLVESVVSECFMPISYGGGVRTVDDFRRLFQIGIEKVSVSSLLFQEPDVVRRAVDEFGSQSVVATLDVKRAALRSRYSVFVRNGQRRVPGSLLDVVAQVEDLGVGEMVVNNIDREGTWQGFDCELMSSITTRSNIPVVAVGGGGSLRDIAEVVKVGGVSAVGLGSMSVFQAKGMGVLINFPRIDQLEGLLR